MRRLCGRPGCGAPASVTFTFDATRCVVWLDSIADGAARAGDLCTRHADSLIPPQGWERVDRRPADAVTVLDVIPSATAAVRSGAARAGDDLLPHRDAAKRRRRKHGTEIPELFEDGTRVAAAEVLVAPKPQPGRSQAPSDPDGVIDVAAVDTGWLPRFANDDDLDGLLDVDTPLLSRAFRNVKPNPKPNE